MMKLTNGEQDVTEKKGEESGCRRYQARSTMSNGSW